MPEELSEKKSLRARIKKQLAKFWQRLANFLKGVARFFGWKPTSARPAEDQSIAQAPKGTKSTENEQLAETPQEAISSEIQKDIETAEQSISKLTAFKEANLGSLTAQSIRIIEGELTALKERIDTLRSHPIKDSLCHGDVKGAPAYLNQVQQKEEAQLAEKTKQEQQQQLAEKQSEIRVRSAKKMLEADNLLSAQALLLPLSKNRLTDQRNLVESLSKGALNVSSEFEKLEEEITKLSNLIVTVSKEQEKIGKKEKLKETATLKAQEVTLLLQIRGSKSISEPFKTELSEGRDALQSLVFNSPDDVEAIKASMEKLSKKIEDAKAAADKAAERAVSERATATQRSATERVAAQRAQLGKKDQREKAPETIEEIAEKIKNKTPLVEKDAEFLLKEGEALISLNHPALNIGTFNVLTKNFLIKYTTNLRGILNEKRGNDNIDTFIRSDANELLININEAKTKIKVEEEQRQKQLEEERRAEAEKVQVAAEKAAAEQAKRLEEERLKQEEQRKREQQQEQERIAKAKKEEEQRKAEAEKTKAKEEARQKEAIQKAEAVMKEGEELLKYDFQFLTFGNHLPRTVRADIWGIQDTLTRKNADGSLKQFSVTELELTIIRLQQNILNLNSYKIAAEKDKTEKSALEKVAAEREELARKEVEKAATRLVVSMPPAKPALTADAPLIQGEKLTQTAIDLIRARGDNISGLETLTIQDTVVADSDSIVTIRGIRSDGADIQIGGGDTVQKDVPGTKKDKPTR